MKEFVGAEAVVRVGKKKVEKIRVRKKYRPAKLDRALRRIRTRIEASILQKAREKGIPVPRVLKVEKYRIVMERIEGKKLSEIDLSPEIFVEVGRIVGKLHSCNMVHGDLTTSNMILTPDGKVYLIDFGLGDYSGNVEDFAMDLIVLKEVLNASHSNIFEEAWRNFLKGYAESFERAGEVVKRLEVIERRYRYK